MNNTHYSRLLSALTIGLVTGLILLAYIGGNEHYDLDDANRALRYFKAEPAHEAEKLVQLRVNDTSADFQGITARGQVISLSITPDTFVIAWAFVLFLCGIAALTVPLEILWNKLRFVRSEEPAVATE